MFNKDLAIQLCCSKTSHLSCFDGDDEISETVIRHDSNAVMVLDNPTEKQWLVALSRQPRLIHTIENPTIDMKMAVMGYYPSLIEDTELNQAQQDKLLSHSRFNYKHIKNITYESLLKVVRGEHSLCGVLKLSKKQIINLVRDLGSTFPFNKLKDNRKINSSEEFKLKLFNLQSGAIVLFDNPSYEMQLKAVTDAGTNLRHIKNPTEELQIIAIKNSQHILSCFKELNATDKTKWIGIKQNISYANAFKDVTKNMIRFVIQNLPNSFNSASFIMPKLLKHCDDEMIEMAIKKDYATFYYVKKPTNKMRAMHKQSIRKYLIEDKGSY